MAKTTPKSSKKEVKSAKAPAKAAAPKKDHKIVAKKAPEKKVDKPVVKHVAKPPVKAPVKPAPKKEDKKAVVAKAPIKPAPKKVEVKKPVPTKAAHVDESKKAKVEKPAAVPAAVAAKAAKGAPKKKGAIIAAKKEEFELEDDLVGEGDDFANDELSEYQAELESAEEEVEEKEIPVEEVPVVVAPPTAKDNSDDIILTDAEGRRYCRVKDCDQVATVDGYCRFHYLLLWKKIQVRKKILTDGKLERYVEELTSRYPDKFLEVIRRDLRTEKDFVSAIQEMEIDESANDSDFEDESSNFIDEVRGASPEGIAEDDEY